MVLGAIAAGVSAINVAGGFAVTFRMLAMFKKSDPMEKCTSAAEKIAHNKVIDAQMKNPEAGKAGASPATESVMVPDSTTQVVERHNNGVGRVEIIV